MAEKKDVGNIINPLTGKPFGREEFDFPLNKQNIILPENAENRSPNFIPVEKLKKILASDKAKNELARRELKMRENRLKRPNRNEILEKVIKRSESKNEEQEPALIKAKKILSQSFPTPDDNRLILNREELLDITDQMDINVEKDREAELEYLDYSKREIQQIIDKFNEKKLLLASDNITQKINFYVEILEEFGVGKKSVLVKNLADCLKYVCSTKSDDIFLGKEENGKAEEFFNSLPFWHPEPLLKNEAENEKKDSQKEKDRVSQDTYDKLAILFMPQIWDAHEHSQKEKLLSGILFLIRNTGNYKLIDAPRLCLRLSEIAVTEKNRDIRDNIYAIFASLSHQKNIFNSIPVEAQNKIIRSMIDNNEYSNELALVVINDEKSGKELRDARDNFKQEVYKELSQDLNILNGYTAPEWLRMVDKVSRMGLIDIDKGEFDHVGIELEFGLLKESEAKMNVVGKTKNMIRNYGKEQPLTDIHIDGSCIEIASGKGGFFPDEQSMLGIRDVLRDFSAKCPNVLLSLHVHIDGAESTAPIVYKLFFDRKVNTEHNTHEIRSLVPPLSGSLLTITDVIHLQNQAVFCSTIGKIPNKMIKKVYSEGYDSKLAIRKAVAINLFSSDDPRQRAAVLSVANRPKTFLEENTLSSIIIGSGIEAQFEDVLDYCVANRKNEIMDRLPRVGGLKYVVEQYDSIKNINVRKHIIDEIANGNIWDVGTNKTEYFKRMFASETNAELADKIILFIAMQPNDEGLAFAKEKFAYIRDTLIKKSIITTIAEKGQKEDLNFIVDNISHITCEEYFYKNILVFIGTKKTFGSDELRLSAYKIIYSKETHVPIKGCVVCLAIEFFGEHGMKFAREKIESFEDKANIIEIIARRTHVIGGLDLIDKYYTQINESYRRKSIIAALRGANILDNSKITDIAKSLFGKETDEYNKSGIITMISDKSCVREFDFIKDKFDFIYPDDFHGVVNNIAKKCGQDGVSFLSNYYEKIKPPLIERKKRCIIETLATNDGKKNFNILINIFNNESDDDTRNYFLLILSDVLYPNGFDLLLDNLQRVDDAHKLNSILMNLNTNFSQDNPILNAEQVDKIVKLYWQKDKIFKSAFLKLICAGQIDNKYEILERIYNKEKGEIERYPLLKNMAEFCGLEGKKFTMNKYAKIKDDYTKHELVELMLKDFEPECVKFCVNNYNKFDERLRFFVVYSISNSGMNNKNEYLRELYSLEKDSELNDNTKKHILSSLSLDPKEPKDVQFVVNQIQAYFNLDPKNRETFDENLLSNAVSASIKNLGDAGFKFGLDNFDRLHDHIQESLMIYGAEKYSGSDKKELLTRFIELNKGKLYPNFANPLFLALAEIGFDLELFKEYYIKYTIYYDTREIIMREIINRGGEEGIKFAFNYFHDLRDDEFRKALLNKARDFGIQKFLPQIRNARYMGNSESNQMVEYILKDFE